MPKKKDQAEEGKYGIITASKKKFHDGEPVFILRATDPFAPDAIRDYADRCLDEGCSQEYADECEVHADRMEEWQDANPDKVKELPN